MVSLIIQGLRFQLRDRKWLTFSIIFPIFLMILTCSIMKNVFTNTNAGIDSVNVYYLSTSSEHEGKIIEILKNSSSDIKLSLNEVSNIEMGKDKVRNSNGVFVVLDGANIKIYSSEKAFKEKIFLSSLIESIGKSSSLQGLIKNSSIGDISLSDTNISDIKIKTNEINHISSSNDYYGVVVTTMMILYTSIIPITILSYDKKENMIDRLKLSGISVKEYFLSRILSSFILSIIISLPGYIFSILVLDTNWGENKLITFGYLCIFNLMVVSLGALICYLIDGYEKCIVILQALIIPLMSFLGGAYIALPDKAGRVFQIITCLSPLRWINRGIFTMVNLNDYSLINTSMIINLSLTLIFFIIFVILIRSEGEKAN